MIGIEMQMPHARIPPCVFQVAAGAGVSGMGLAVIDWRVVTGQATAAIALAGFVGGSVVGGIIYAIGQYDKVAIERKKRWDDANKESLSAQLARLTEQNAEGNRANLENQAKMRESLHNLRNDNQAQQAENSNLRDDLATLRGQFIEISKELRATDVALHAAHDEMRKTRLELQRTTEALVESEKDRTALRAELGALRRTQAGQGERLTKLEQGSAESFPIPQEILDAPAPTSASQGTGAAKPNSPARPS